MTPIRSIRMTRCSLVVSPVDIWTRRMPAPAALSVMLAGIQRKPVRKPDGTYLFFDLPEGSYLLNINSPSFIPVSEWVETSRLNPLHPVVTVPLLPGPGYMYPAASTAVRLRLVGTFGAPRAGVAVEAYATGDETARGRVSQEQLPAGETSIRVSLPQGQTVAGESLLLRGQGKQELVRIAEVLPDGVWRLEQPIEHSYKRGASLLPAVRTYSSEGGVVLLPFRGVLPRTFAATLQVGLTKLELELRSGEVLEAPPVLV